MDESTGLLPDHAPPPLAFPEVAVGVGSSSDGIPADDLGEAELWQELGAPWPATSARTTSLLASPVIANDRVNQLTKSPKPGNTPLAQRQRMVCFLRSRVFSIVVVVDCESSVQRL